MRTISAELQAHIDGEATTLAVCWRVERSDGVLILGTEHDANLTISAGSYAGTYVAQAGITGSDVRSSSDMSVDNMEVDGALNQGDLSIIDLSAADIESGLFDNAAVTLFIVNWQAPDDGEIVLRSGTIGEITRTAEGQYRTELRGLAQALTQNVVRTYSPRCDAELGDSRCKFVIDNVVVEGEVTAVSSNRAFTATIAASSPPVEEGYYKGGKLIWVTGENAGYISEVKLESLASSSGDSDIVLFLPMYLDVQVGDTFNIQPGCDKSPAMCKGRFANLVNFRGHGAWVPGLGEMMAFGGQTSTKRDRAEAFLQWPRS